MARAKPGVYAAREIQGFLERYFIREGKIPRALFDEGLALKAAMLGGKDDSVTATELDATTALVRRLAPRLAVHRLEWSRKESTGDCRL